MVQIISKNEYNVFINKELDELFNLFLIVLI